MIDDATPLTIINVKSLIGAGRKTSCFVTPNKQEGAVPV